jgi:hypothetical protein
LGNPDQKFRPILEAATAYGASGLVRGGESLECREEFLSINAKNCACPETHVCVCKRNCILIAKKIRDQRRISGAARGRRKSAAGGGCDQHSGFSIRFPFH